MTENSIKLGVSVYVCMYACMYVCVSESHLSPGLALPLSALVEVELPLPVGGGLLVGSLPCLYTTIGLLQLCLSLLYLLLQPQG